MIIVFLIHLDLISRVFKNKITPVAIKVKIKDRDFIIQG